MLLFVVVVVGNKLMPTKALFYHWKHGSLGGTKSRVWFLPLSNPTVRYIAFCNDTSPARLGWPQICPGLKKRGIWTPIQPILAINIFLPDLVSNIFSRAILPDSASNMASIEEKKGAAQLIETFSYITNKLLLIIGWGLQLDWRLLTSKKTKVWRSFEARPSCQDIANNWIFGLPVQYQMVFFATSLLKAWENG